MDGAKAHVKPSAEIEKLAATRIQMHGQKTPIIRFVQQSTNSPDTNVLDLCFFRSPAKLVSKDEMTFKRGYLGKEAVWEHAVETSRKYDDEKTMDRCWRMNPSSNRSLTRMG